MKFPNLSCGTNRLSRFDCGNTKSVMNRQCLGLSAGVWWVLDELPANQDFDESAP